MVNTHCPTSDEVHSRLPPPLSTLSTHLTSDRKAMASSVGSAGTVFLNDDEIRAAFQSLMDEEVKSSAVFIPVLANIYQATKIVMTIDAEDFGVERLRVLKLYCKHFEDALQVR